MQEFKSFGGGDQRYTINLLFDNIPNTKLVLLLRGREYECQWVVGGRCSLLAAYQLNVIGRELGDVEYRVEQHLERCSAVADDLQVFALVVAQVSVGKQLRDSDDA